MALYILLHELNYGVGDIKMAYNFNDIGIHHFLKDELNLHNVVDRYLLKHIIRSPL